MMKKITTILMGTAFALVSLCTQTATAQTFEVEPATTVVNSTAGTEHGKALIHVKNISGEKITLRWDMITNTFDDTEWEYSYCDAVNCYLQIPENASFEMNPDTSAQFYVETTFNGKDGEGMLKIRLYDVNSGDEDTLTFQILRGASSIVENTVPASDVNVYPNPAQEVLNISTAEGFTPNKVLVTTMTGQQVLSADLNNSASAQVNVADLPAGVYIINLYDRQGRMSVNRFVKQ